MKKIILLIVSCLAYGIIIGLPFDASSQESTSTTNNNMPNSSDQSDVFRFNADTGHGRQAVIDVNKKDLLFTPVVHTSNESGIFATSLNFVKNPELEELYHKIGNYGTSEKVVFVYPIFTQAAYGKNGFYDFYENRCGAACLTVPIPEKIKAIYSSSAKGANVLHLLNYSFMTDIDIDQNPDILNNYDKVILLHNEYVTQKEFDAIIHHPHVIFLYPNALYAKVKVNYDKNTITLLRGHGFPQPQIHNGFDFQYDNSKYEYNYDCTDWTFYKKGNYTMLNCYPEYKILHARELLITLKEKDPTNIVEDISTWLTYPKQYNATQELLSDFDINGTTIPSWVVNPAVWVENSEITKDEFGNILDYLYQNKIIK